MPLTYEEMHKRLRTLLKSFLEKDGYRFGSMSIPAIADFFSETTPHELYDLAVSLYKKNNSEEKFRELAERIIPQLVERGVFAQNEVTDENKPVIAKLFAEMEIVYRDIVRKKEEGNFTVDDSFFPENIPVQAYIPPVPTITQAKEAKEPLLYSEAMDRYITTKLSDGKWKEHSRPDQEQRLRTFLEIMGDKPIDDISREEMRHFRETLRKLPPNRTKSKAYKDKTIAEILDMAPTQVLNVKTVNIILEATASLFDWCTHEEYLSHNPAKSLQIKDDRQDIELRDAFSAGDIKKIFNSPKYARACRHSFQPQHDGGELSKGQI